MIWNFIKASLALGGIFLGNYLMVLAYTTRLSGPAMNNVVITLGFIMASACGIYLLIKIMNGIIN